MVCSDYSLFHETACLKVIPLQSAHHENDFSQLFAAHCNRCLLIVSVHRSIFLPLRIFEDGLQKKGHELVRTVD